MIVTRTLAAAAIAFLAISGATAPAEARFTANGLSLNGLSLNGISVNAYARNGLVMNGAHLNGASAVAPRIVGVELPPAR